MEKRTWPYGSDGRQVPRAFSSALITGGIGSGRKCKRSQMEMVDVKRSSSSGDVSGDVFSSIPTDLLRRIAGSFTLQTLWAASGVCRAWKEALGLLREATVFVQWGKRFKHGLSGVSKNREKALHCFLKGAARGSAAAMVDAGLLLWEMGKKAEGVELYRAAAELGDPAGQCNLGLFLLQGQVWIEAKQSLHPTFVGLSQTWNIVPWTGGRINQLSVLGLFQVFLFTAASGLGTLPFSKTDLFLPRFTSGLLLKLAYEFKVDPKKKKQRNPILPQLNYEIAWGYFYGASQGHPLMCGVGTVLFKSRSHSFHIRYSPGRGSNIKADLLLFGLCFTQLLFKAFQSYRFLETPG